jgi:hypothetical protein
MRFKTPHETVDWRLRARAFGLSLRLAELMSPGIGFGALDKRASVRFETGDELFPRPS